MTDHWDGLAVSTSGSGPGVLWLHGYTMTSEVWRPLWSRLPGWRHIGVDLPWHGDSRPLRAGEDLAALADTIVALSTTTGARHVVALSFGTVVAVEMAIRHPAAFGTWTLAAPALAGMPHEPAVVQRYVDLAMLYRRRGPGPHMTDLWMSSPPGIFAAVAARPAVAAPLRALIDRHAWTELRGTGMLALTDRRQRAAALDTLAAPVLLMVGEHELACHRTCARSILSAGRSSVLREVPGAGHLAPLEEPDAAAALIDAQLRR